MSFLIHGRGLAAALTIDALLTEGITPSQIWVEGELSPPAGSLAPAALLNPLTGRSLKPPVEGPSIFASSQETWKRLEKIYPNLIHSKTVFRPFLSGHKLFEKLHKTFNEHIDELQSGWGVRPATNTELEVLRRVTGPETLGAITIEGCFAVELEAFLASFWKTLTHSGLNCGNHAPTGSTVIRCDGAALKLTLSPTTELQSLGGELFEIAPLRELPIDYALAGDGHYIPLDAQRAVIGSTYHRHGQTLESPPWEHLQRRLRSWLPLVDASPQRAWYGERLIAPDDRKPIIGSLPKQDNTFVCTGFASKGLYWGPYATQALVKHILHQTPLPNPISIARFL